MTSAVRDTGGRRRLWRLRASKVRHMTVPHFTARGQSGVVAVDGLGGAGRLVAAVDLDGERQRHLHAVALDLLHGADDTVEEDLRADGDGLGKRTLFRP